MSDVLTTVGIATNLASWQHSFDVAANCWIVIGIYNLAARQILLLSPRER